MTVEGDIRCILVGAGGFGQVWADLNRSNMGARIVAIVDTDSAALNRAGSDLSLYASDQFTTLRDALESVEADAVIDSTPPEYHLAHAELAFARGLHLFTAKPASESWSDAVRMTTAAEEAGLVLAVNEQLRFGWLPLAITSVIESGEIGTVEAVEVVFREPSNWHGWRASMQHPLLLDAAIQHFDMVRAVTGLEVESAFCRSWRRAWSTFSGSGCASALLTLTGGVPFTYLGSWEQSPDGDATGWWGEWHIQGTTGDLRAEGTRGLWINGRASAVAVENLDVRRLSRIVLDQFLRAIRTGAPAATDGWNDLHSLSMSELCIRSAASGAPVSVAELDPPLPGQPVPRPVEPVVEPAAPAPYDHG